MPKDAKLYSVTNSSTSKRCELPALVARVENHAIKELSKALAEVFDRADDALFEMADRAVSNSEQNLYFESMREIRIRRRGLENGFRQALENNFFALVSDAAREGESSANPNANNSLSNNKSSNSSSNSGPSNSSASNDECSLDNLTLMKNDDLEASVAIDGMVSKFKNLTSVEIGKLNCRFETLLSGTKVDEGNNPLGAVKIVQSFTNMGAILDLDIKTKLILFKLFDAQVLGHAVKLVIAANKIFADAGVLPHLKNFSPRRPTPSTPTASSLSVANDWGSDQTVQQEVGQDQDSRSKAEFRPQERGIPGSHHLSSTGFEASNQGYPNVFETIQSLLSLSRNSETGGHSVKSELSELEGGTSIQSSSHSPYAELGKTSNEGPSGSGAKPVGEGKQVSRPNLMAMLSAIQSSFHQGIGHDESSGFQLDLQHELDRILKGQEEKRGRFRIDQNDDDVINVVGMMFNVILEDRNLSDSMKAVIGRLQIPLVKVALLDQSFFSQSSHPARKLLNGLAKAGVGCVDENHSGRDAIFCKIQFVVQEVLDQNDHGIELYESLLTEFDLFIKKEEKRSALIERRILDAEAGRAKTDQARSEVNVAIQSLLAGKEIPPVVLKLIKGAWANVLFVALLKGGADTKVWQKKLSTASDLIWSVQSASATHSKQRLLEMVPSLLVDLREGLTEISFNPCDMSLLFADLQGLHLHLLEGDTGACLNDVPQHEKAGLFDGQVKVPARQFRDDSLSGSSLSGDAPSCESLPSYGALPESTVSSSGGQKSIADITKEILEKSLGQQPSAQSQNRGSGGVSANPKAMAESAKADKGSGSQRSVNQQSALKPTLDSSASDLVSKSSNDEEVVSEHQYLEQYRRLDALGVGSWVEFVMADGTRTRCKLAAKITSQKKFIFVNRNGVKIIERLRYELAQSMENGGFIILDDSCLFDRALESVISNLRGNQSNAHQSGSDQSGADSRVG